MLLSALFSDDLSQVPFILLACMFIVFVALPIHELSHAFVAFRLGDRTAKNMGRLTLNPMSHLDPIGTVMIVLFGFGWAKPVPINMNNLRNPKRDMAISALAGPVSNVIVAFILLALSITLGFNYYDLFFGASNTGSFFGFAIMINLWLASFNLIPLPPLDGSHILKAFLPTRLYYDFMKYEQYFMIIVMILLVTRILTGPLEFISSGLLSFISLPFKALGLL
jgi:Zn-dependent protease